MIKEGEKVNFSKKYEKKLDEAVMNAFKDISNNFIFSIPNEWSFSLVSKTITFSDIKEKMLENGLSVSCVNKYYGVDSTIKVDTNIIMLDINDNGIIKSYPILLCEDKKQGTNDKRILEGKGKQAVGNAIERGAKNFTIISDYCFLCDHNFFPYVIFAHGCDFGDDMTKTMKAKIEPYIGELNKINPFFDKEIWWSRKGGTCICKSDEFTIEEMQDTCYKICKTGIEHYLKRFAVNINEKEAYEAAIAST